MSRDNYPIGVTVSPTPATTGPPSITTRFGYGNRRGILGWLIERADLFALAVLVIAAAFPASPPTAGELLSGEASGLWNTRVAGANVFELMILVPALLWLVRSQVLRPRTSSFNRALLAGALAVLCTQAIALTFNYEFAEFFALDLERVLIPAAAYILVTQAVNDRKTLFRFSTVIGVVLVLRFIQLVIVHGIIGTTEFGTITGRFALLITEDVLIILFPLALLWGRLLDGRSGVFMMAVTIGLLAGVVAVDFLSLRRGALLMIGAALAIRTLAVSPKRIAQICAAGLIAFLLLVAAGPARPVLPDIKYAAQSIVLQSEDSSSSQRTSEMQSFFDNMNGVDWVTGRGLGVTWNALEAAPIDAASYGSGESALVRIGWHVYGLDYAYKLGLAGVLVFLVTMGVIARKAWRSYRSADPELAGFMYSVAVCLPFFLLLLFTNPRVGLMAGICLGMLSVAGDIADRERASSQTSTTPTR